MELSQAHLRYLLAIGELSQGKAAVSSTQVARVLQVSRPSVTRMLAVLAEKDLVTKERYGKITLTETGAALAHQLQAGLRDLERRLPALGLDLDREETAAKLRLMQPSVLDILPLTLEEVFTYEMEALGYAFGDLLPQ